MSVICFFHAVQVIDTRMQSIRNQYQRMYRVCKSGSSPIPKTDRQREIKKLLWFLRQHIKTAKSVTSYKEASPPPKDTSTPFRPVKSLVSSFLNILNIVYTTV